MVGSGGQGKVGSSSQQTVLVDIQLVVYTVVIPQGRGDTTGNISELPTAYQFGVKKQYLKSTKKGTSLVYQIRLKCVWESITSTSYK